MFELLPNTRTLAVLCAFSVYDVPLRATRRRLQALERVEPAMQRLQTLLASDRFAAAHIQTVALLNADDTTLIGRLRDIREAVQERSGVNMVMFWSGHGNVHDKSFRLAARNTGDPIEYEDGLGLDEVLRQSGVARVSTWTLLLDACYAGEGLGDVMGAAQELLKSESGTLRGYGALCASSPFEKARDSVFLETVVDVLAQGPSEAVRLYAEREGGGGAFNPFNKLLSLSELFDAVSNEYRANPSRYRNAEPWPILGGAINPRVFPNPQFQDKQPSRLAENAHRPIARTTDLESHFFPKASGIDNLEAGWHFAGRVEASRAILDWMARPSEQPPDRLYVLCGDGGTGKSALLGRLIALTDPAYRAKAKAQGWDEMRDVQAGTVPLPDRIDAALSLRNLTPQTLAEHLASLLCLGSFDTIEGFVRGAVQAYHRPDALTPCIVLDALDEASEPAALVYRLIHPLVQAGWKVLVATRRSAAAKGANDLIGTLGPATVCALDHDEQSGADIHDYVQGRLRSAAGLASLASDAAQIISERAGGKFLFARMATSSLMRRAETVTAADLPRLIAGDATEALTQEFAALDQDFQRHFACDAGGALAMLTALAWSQGDGVPLRDGIWAAMTEAVASLKGPTLKFEERHLLWLLREAGRFIQESGDGEQAVYRLFHQSLADHFQRGWTPNDPVLEALDERIAQSLVGCVRAARDWESVNPYLVRHLPAHLSLRPDQKGLNKLLLNFDWIEARLQLSGIQALLGDYRLCREADPATGRLHRTLSMVAHILRKHPEQLNAQLLGRIERGVPDITPLLEGETGANFSLSPPSLEVPEAAEFAKPIFANLPGLSISQQGVDLRQRTLSLDGLLDRARGRLRGPRWIPALGGLRQAGALVLTLEGHDSAVNSVALSADGHTIVSGGHDNTVRLWDAESGQALRILAGHEDAVASVALSADGRRIVSGSHDKTVRLWGAESSQALRILAGHEDTVTSVALSADGFIIVSGSHDKTVRLWDAKSGQALRTLAGHDDGVTSVALSADGCTIVSGSKDKTVRLWDALSGQALRTLKGHDNGVTSVALSADGRTIVSSSYDNTVCLWDAASGQPLQTLADPEVWVFSVALSVDGRTIVAGSDDGTVRLWDALSGQAPRTLTGHESRVTTVALSASGRTIVSGSDDTTVRRWDAASGQALRSLKGHERRVFSAALSADGRTIASGSDDKTVHLWDAESGQALHTLAGHEDGVMSVALSADGRTIVSGSDDGTVRQWDAASGQHVRTLFGHEGWVASVAVSTDGRTIFSAGQDKTVRLWDAASGQALRTLKGHEDGVGSVAVSHDGRTIVSGSSDKTVRLWDAVSGQALRTLAGHEGEVDSVAVSADGRTIVSGSHDKTVRLWDAESGEVLRTLEGHEEWVTSVAVNADSRTIVSGSQDKTVRVWDAASGRLMEVLCFDAAVNGVSLANAEGQARMVVASGLAAVRLSREGDATVLPRERP